MVCDEQLVQRSLAGDEDAFREIVDRYKAYVFAIILNFVNEQYEAENIAQEVFLQIYRSLPQYRFQSFKSWVGKIAANKAIDWRRSRRREPLEELLTDFDRILRDRGESLADPEKIWLQKEKQRRIREICAGLPEVYSRAVVKFYLEGKSYQEIASEEGTTVKTVESRLYRARHLFRERWEEGGS
ncbi:MAG: polymerase, sigma-24 subunit, subfamily [Peptococcaceae bacterium]|jgi:RNA polymerase sigma factor (sigma-70 family)|nr:polymerase, sigma-24 subunit, subfamily [Peptococcaceae bacterium]